MKVSLLRFGQHCGSGQDKAWFSLSFLVVSGSSLLYSRRLLIVLVLIFNLTFSKGETVLYAVFSESSRRPKSRMACHSAAVSGSTGKPPLPSPGGVTVSHS